MTKVAIIILNWNQPKLTQETITSFKKIIHNSFDYQIFIVDNGSTDNSIGLFHQNYSRDKVITILETKANLGYVGGNNYGLQHAFQKSFDYYLVANNDIEVSPNFLEILINSANKNPQVGILGPKIYFAPHHEYHHDRYKDSDRGKVIWSAGGQIDWDNIDGTNIGVDAIDSGQFNQSFQPDFISGCCMLVRHSVIQKIGFFDPDYFLYLEDTDYSRRALKAGFQLLFVPESIIWHINAGSSSPGSQLHNYFLTRNRLLFASKYARFRTKFAIIRESLKVLLTDPSIWRKKAVLDFYLHRLGKGSWQ